MSEAIALSIEKMQAGEGGPFGALVVKDGEVVGRGWNRVTSTNDPTAHAEIMAIRDAGGKLGTFDLSGCEIYSSCEPCPMCLSAIYWARLDKLTYGATRADAAAAGFDDEVLYREMSKDWPERRLPAEQTMQPEAQKAFQLWNQHENRINY